MTPWNTRAAAVILLAFCTGGCNSPAASDNAAPAPPAAAAAKPAEPATAAPPPAAPVAPASLASADGEQPGLRVEIQELKRTEGNTLTLKLAVINTGGGTQFSVGDLKQATLIDAVGKKKYFAATDAAGACLCSPNVSLGASDRANLWAKFPAPPADVQKIAIVIPHFPPLEGIPISE